jgi:site-specific DNA-methyltransferase (adenine-specific)
MLCFYGWNRIDKFFDAWKDAGFQPVGHIVFRKSYSSNSRFLRYQHEQGYLLAKGRPPLPKQPLTDVMDMPYSGNKLHPTQKPVPALAQLIRSFTLPDELVLDPFAGSGSSCAAALLTGRRYIGVELDAEYHLIANQRLSRVKERIAKRSSPSFPTRVYFARTAARVKASCTLASHSSDLDSRLRAVLFAGHVGKEWFGSSSTAILTC